jgi:hypothetical protein
MHNGRYLTFPKGFKRTHRKKNVLQLAQTHSVVLANVQQEWETMMEEFPKRVLDDKTVLEIVNDKKLGFGDKMRKLLYAKFRWSQHNGNEYTLWDFFNDAIDFVAGKNYKSDFHKRNQIDGIVQKILEYGFLAKLVI